MAQSRGPLGGFNTNLRHAGRVFHVQTEDLGVQKAQLETHLFVGGGEVLATRRTSYDAGADTSDVIRAMKAQHKGLLIAVRDGEFDTGSDADPDSRDAPSGGPGSLVLVGGERLREHAISEAEVSDEVAAALRELLRVQR